MMEENISQVQSAGIQNKPKRPWLKVVLLAVAGPFLTGGLVFAGIQIGKQQATRNTKQATRISPIPSPLIGPSPTFPPEQTPSPDETAEWKTYTNTKYGYSIKYPSGFNYKISEKGEAMVAFDSFPEVLESSAAEDKTLVIIVADTSKPVIDKNFFGEPAQTAEEIEVIIDGEVGQQVVFSKPVAWIQTAVPHGKRSFYFNLQNMQYRPEYNQILSTFRFLLSAGSTGSP